MKKVRKIALVLVGVLALLVVTLWATAAHWRSEAVANLAGSSKVAQTAHGPIEYATLGEGPVVLVLHGSLGGYDQGLLIAQAVGGAGFKYIAVSRLGYLRTPPESGPKLEAQADAYVDLLDALKIDKAAILAYSAGGHSAVTCGLQHPERRWGLVLLSAHTARCRRLRRADR